ncbi:probable alkaline neutral invertase D [Olea europaea subsp. europaea]|uniref:Probable alkaline neutral invertase D n=1 Tax=Olea europaea subsp. europaea TaxID=158383 RepID=A0A8S0UNN6_OLEEU|nr:probable alkaline neutral invertase D [Olea europaea subsp. europaea]
MDPTINGFNPFMLLYKVLIFRLIMVGAVLLWLLTAACIKTGRPQIARRAIELAEARLSKDGWPEYYDGKLGRYIGKQARRYQTWSISGYLVAKMMLEDPSHLGMVAHEEDKQLKPVLKRSSSWTF